MNRSFTPLKALATTGLFLLCTLPAGAADLSKEMSTAVTHAGLAAGSADLKTVQVHLHHVVNCLVGPDGAGFDAGPGNPCKDQGAGAIPDAPADKKASLQEAVASAQSGLAETDLAKAKATALSVQALLKKAE